MYNVNALFLLLLCNRRLREDPHKKMRVQPEFLGIFRPFPMTNEWPEITALFPKKKAEISFSPWVADFTEGQFFFSSYFHHWVLNLIWGWIKFFRQHSLWWQMGIEKGGRSSQDSHFFDTIQPLAELTSSSKWWLGWEEKICQYCFTYYIEHENFSF